MRRFEWMTWIGVASLVWACGSDDKKSGFSPASGGSANAGGTAGSTAGTAGSGASAGVGGTSGAGGTAAVGGTAGTSMGGAAGTTAGAAGMSGSAGSAGASGTGGTAGAAGAAGMAGAAGSAGMAGTGGMLCPNDMGPEPNDTEVIATPVCLMVPCEFDECDDSGSTGNGGTLPPATGVIGPGDVDYWTFFGQDTLGFCTVNAAASTTDSGFELCMFAGCPNGTNLNGCTQGVPAMSMIGIPGCCVTAPGTVELDHDCIASPNDNDSADVYIRISQANACTSYSVEYHF